MESDAVEGHLVEEIGDGLYQRSTSPRTRWRGWSRGRAPRRIALLILLAALLHLVWFTVMGG